MRQSHKAREQQRGRRSEITRERSVTTRSRRKGHRRGRQSSITAFMWTALAAYLSVVAFTDSAISSILGFGNGVGHDPDRAGQMRARNTRENYHAVNEAEQAFLRTGKRGLDSTTKKEKPRVHVKRIKGAKAKLPREQLERDPIAREELPPLSSILVNGKVVPNANTAMLLDYAIIGFAKTGTTSVHRHLASAHTYTLNGEHCELVVNDTAKLIRAIYDDHGMRVKNSQDGIVEKRKRGIKCPQDIQSSAHNYARYFPETKLLVGIRHPIDWFESLYNYRLSNVPWKEMLPTSNLTRGCGPGSQGVCAWRASFHDFLSTLGKTPMNSNEEKKLLTLGLEPVETKVGNVFLYDVAQLSEKRFRRDLQDFLGLSKDIPEFPAISTAGRFDHIDSYKQKSSRKKIDICDDQHEKIRRVLLQKAQRASIWIHGYFMKSPDVHISDRKFFVELLKSWQRDPCG